MATISARGKSRFIQFDFRGRRRTLSIGRAGRKDAENVRTHVERIVVASELAQPLPLDTVKWTKDLAPKFHARLAQIGLVAARASANATELETMVDNYIARRSEVKESTRIKFRQCKGELLGWFGPTKDIRTITAPEARDWQVQLGKRLAAATVATRVKDAKTIFRDAADRGLIELNPFAKLKPGTQVNDARLQYVPAMDIETVAAEAKGTPLERVVILARFGGLRCPSESDLLAWADVDLERRRMRVTSPKTAHHAGKDFRWMAIMPELHLKLVEWKAKDEKTGQKWICRVGQYKNLRSNLTKVLARLGPKVWPRLFQNLRASCETDLLAKVPLPIACKMIGNSPTVASRHYVAPADHHFDEVSGRIEKSAAESAAEDGGNGRKSSEGKTRSEPENVGNPRETADIEWAIQGSNL